jgi:cytochrome oxidase assembly protein ShyY1
MITVDSDDLSALWQTQLARGYVMMQVQDPYLLAADAPAPVIIPPTVQVGDAPFPLQNFVYAFQWWLFGAFALGLYGWWLWRESQDRSG